MPSLQVLQDTITAAILGGGTATISKELHAGPADVAGRFKIFRNNTYASLTECLKAEFPVTVRLSDERFFAFAATSSSP